MAHLNGTQRVGVAVGIIVAARRYEAELHAGLDDAGLPAECHKLVAKGQARRLEHARRQAVRKARMPERVLFREARQRGAHFAVEV